MKIRYLLLMLLGITLLAGCRPTEESYESRREKTADMQDASILEMKEDRKETEASVPATEKPVTEKPATEEVTEQEPELPGVVVLTGTLNMRSGPGVDYELLVELDADDVIEILGEEEAEDTIWYQVDYDGTTGFVEEEALGYATEGR